LKRETGNACGRATAGYREPIPVELLIPLLLLSGVVVSVALPRGHHWLFLFGLVGSVVTATALWVATGYEDVEVPPSYAAVLFVLVYGGLWTLGVAIGFLFREAVGAWTERRRWR
jgi:hypothetical protein